MSNEKTINIGCEGTHYIDYKELNEFQEDIKSINKSNLAKLKNSIKNSFRVPFFVWESKDKLWILNGHQRAKALAELEEEGFKIPKVPIIKIFADTVEQAKSIVLECMSQHGDIDLKKLSNYTEKYKINLHNIVLKKKEIECLDINRKINVTKEKIKPYKKIHYLISVDIKDIDKVSDLISNLQGIQGVEIEQSSN